MSGHTEGPLVAVREPSHPLDGLWMVAPAGEITACTASYCTEADAKLYAAAPELLEALRALQLQALQSPDLIATDWGQEALALTKAALRKATSPTMNTQAILRDQGRG